ncbi:hypothetical protein [Sphingobium yanoikuyae]|nr:hypothetical protein [Sphingobium yanoikuyae]
MKTDKEWERFCANQAEAADRQELEQTREYQAKLKQEREELERNPLFGIF